MHDCSKVADNFRENELRAMIDADTTAEGATHPLIVTAACALSMALCPTTYCTKEC